MKGNILAEEEFGRWLKPPDALARLDSTWTPEAKQDWILGRLGTGVLRACAEHSEIRDRNGIRISSFQLIGGQVWRAPWHWTGAHFWTTGDATFSNSYRIGNIYFPTRPKPGTGNDTAILQGIRFDPAGFPYLEVAASNNIRDERPHLKEDDAKGFCRTLNSTHPNATRAEALASARRMFPLNKLPRDWFYAIFSEIRGHRKPGRVPKNRIER